MKTKNIYEIEKLHQLQKKGVISKAEFEKEKNKLFLDEETKKTDCYISWSNVFISFFISILFLIPCSFLPDNISEEISGVIILLLLLSSCIVSSIVAESRR